MGTRETMDQYVSRMYQAYLRLLSIKESFEGSNEDYFKLWLLIQMKNQPYTELRDRLIEEPQDLMNTMKSLRAVACCRVFDAQGACRPVPSASMRRIHHTDSSRHIPAQDNQDHDKQTSHPSDGHTHASADASVYVHLSRIPDETWQQLPPDVRDRIAKLRAEDRAKPRRTTHIGQPNNGILRKPPDESQKQYGGAVRANLLSSHMDIPDATETDTEPNTDDPTHGIHMCDFADY